MKELCCQSAEELFLLQKKEWTMLRMGYEALSEVEERKVRVMNAEFKIQYNPARLRSSSARIDKESIAARRCFLCAENRPSEQRGIAWRDYTLIVNPYPIFPVHFTIPTVKHTDQRIISRFRDMMQLASVLAGYTVFYNGPECGASAPDHAHFQAGTSGIMPIEAEVESCESEIVAQDGEKAALRIVRGLGRMAFVVDSFDIESGARLFEALYNALDAECGKEPMINVLCIWKKDKGWTTIIFPRAKHRPACYYAHGDERILVSPASVDLGGVFITPLKEDYNRLTATDLQAILDEVCIGESYAADVVGRIKNKTKIK